MTPARPDVELVTPICRVSSIVVGLTVEMWTWFFPGAVELKNTGALIALIVILLVRPQGILGKKERVG